MFDLLYWSDLDVRHCIDVMHVEKNVCHSVIGMLLNIQGKTKDGLNTRLSFATSSVNHTLIHNQNVHNFNISQCHNPPSHVYVYLTNQRMLNFALILNPNNNVIISKEQVISQFITYLIYH